MPSNRHPIPNPKSKIQNPKSKDYLWLNLRDLPFFRALLRAVEAHFYEDISLPAPTLDMGCGDGHFATIAFDRPLEVGIDPWWGPLQRAKARGAYQNLVQADGGKIPFPNGYFASAVSNSVLEHIDDVESVLNEIARVLKPGAPFIFCVPNDNFLPALSVGRLLNSIGLRPLGKIYRSFFNRLSRHLHCDPPGIWERRVQNSGFQIERWWHYFSPAALRILEWGHYFGLPSLISYALSGRWVLSPTRWNLALTQRLVQKHYHETPALEDGVYTFYITHRQ